MKCVVGLGNPGATYALTRHNIGFLVVDALAERAGQSIKLRECEALTGRVAVGGESVLLVKPQTYMNASGHAVAPLCAKYGVDPRQDLLAVVDDVALPFGRLRLRGKGSSGGHNGLKSLAAKLKTESYARLRVGIGPEHPVRDLANFVLGAFSGAERSALPELTARAADAVEAWVQQGLAPAMARFNA
ncbi:MAG: aminoacyl-tRNA hydrolase [Chloracidobacterium sp. CP2_5A]|nr:MAG: aminoacyl-tRNA hydrolase [Chloracidobacterium sp. CP2_5A]